MLDAQL